MPHPSTQSEILAALESNALTIAAFYAGQPDHVIFTGDPERWGPAHHLLHLTQSSAAVTRGLSSGSLPSHPAGRSRSYAEVRDATAATLAATPKPRLLEMGRVVVVAPEVTRAGLVDDFATASAELRAAAAAWDEDRLDAHAMKHPLIGALTAREMLFFCVFHERHHLKLVRARVEAATARP